MALTIDDVMTPPDPLDCGQLHTVTPDNVLDLLMLDLLHFMV